MAKTKVVSQSTSKARRPALTPEARENQMISLAVDLAEKQLLEGTASSQVITHFLKLATAKERLEREKLEQENKLLIAKTEALQSQKHIEELYANAISAMRNYSGMGGEPDEEYEDY
jgi:hypothetical protein